MAEDLRNMKSTSGIKEFEKQYELPHCVVLDSEYCSMGRMIAVKACKASGYAYYDAVILLDLVPEEGVTIDEALTYEKRLRSDEIDKEKILADPEYIRIEKAFDKAIDIALSRGPCLIHDRAVKETILAKGYSCISVLMYAEDMSAKIVKAKFSPLYENLTDDAEVIQKIHEEDMARTNLHKLHSDTAWGEKNAYDLMINSDMFGRDFSAVVLASAMTKH